MILLLTFDVNDRKGDYYRYLAEFLSGSERKGAADESMKAYEVVQDPTFILSLFLPVYLESIPCRVYMASLKTIR